MGIGESMSVICADKSRGYYFLWFGKRKPMSAEVTLVFDNSDQQLDLDMAGGYYTSYLSYW